jgi:microcin C transport system permease protein
VRTYLFRRLLLVIPTFIGITLMVFAMTRFVPGGPIERAIAEMQQKQQGRQATDIGSSISEDQVQQLREFYGFDQAWYVAYYQWLKKLLRLDLGESTRYGIPVWEAIVERLPVSFYYGIVSTILTYLICVPLGVFKALNHKKISDNMSSILVYIGYAVPSYVIGIILLVIFASQLEWFPLGGFTGDDFEDYGFIDKTIDIVWHSVLPMAAYVAGSFAVMTLLMKNSLMDFMSSDFVRTAIAKGLNYRQAIVRHALRNSLIPIATHFGSNISSIIAGSFLIEKIFNINGFGLLGYEAVVERDYPVVMGILVVSALLQLVGNILSDICVAIADPRVEFK